MRRRPPGAPRLRVIWSADEQGVKRSIGEPDPDVPAGAAVATYIDPYIRCGQDVIDAATVAIVDAAFEHGLDGGVWDRDVVRQEVSEMIVRKIYATMALHMSRGSGSHD